MARTACRITKSSLPSAQRPGTPEPTQKETCPINVALAGVGTCQCGSGKKELLVGSSKHKEVPGKLRKGQLLTDSYALGK